MITANAKQDLYKLMSNNGISPTQNSNILPNPSFDGTLSLNFKSSIETKLSITGFNIIDILGYNDLKVVYGNANNKGIIGIFDLENNLVETINKVDDYTGNTTGTIDIDQIKILDIDKNGFIYGLTTENNETYFIRLSDILSQVGILAISDIDTFYTARVLMSVETPKDANQPTKDIMGATLFNDYEKISISNDFKNSETYSFAMWKSSDKKIHITQINVPLGSLTQSEIEWKINEYITLNKEGDYFTINDLSQIGIATGGVTIDSEQIVGSLILGTSKSSVGTSLKETHSDLISLINWPTLEGISSNHEIVGLKHNFTHANPLINKNIVFDLTPALTRIRELKQNVNAVDLESTIDFKLFTRTGSSNIVINLSKDLVDQALLDDNLSLVLKPIATNVGSGVEIVYSRADIVSNLTPTDSITTATFAVPADSINQYDVTIPKDHIVDKVMVDNLIINPAEYTVNGNIVSISIFGETRNKNFVVKVYHSATSNNNLERVIKKDIDVSSLFDGLSHGRRLAGQPYEGYNAYSKWSGSVNATIHAKYKLSVSSTTSAETTLLKITNINDKMNYQLSQAKQDITKSSRPVFLNELKAYVPLSEYAGGTYNIFEFDVNSETIKNKTLTLTYIAPSTLTVGGTNIEITINNVNNQGIQSVSVNNFIISNDRYTFVDNKLTVSNVLSNEVIHVTYNTNISTPKKIILDSHIHANAYDRIDQDVFIYGINNKNELNTTSDNLSIVGVGDTRSRYNYGFTLYSNNQNTELNALSEDVKEENMKIEHMVATRQNNLIYIFGYNADFTKEIKWISIYPQSFEPYTMLPYDDKKKEFHLSRLNGSETSDIKDTRFDNSFENVSSTGTTIIGNTNAKTTDFNYDGKATLTSYGKTNKAIFQTIIDYVKIRQETKGIYVNVNTSIVDETSGSIQRNEASATLAKIFDNKNEGHEDLIQTNVLKLVYSDNTFKEVDITNMLFMENNKLTLKATIARGSKDIVKIQWLNKNKDILGEAIPCYGDLLNITWDLVIEDTNDTGNVVSNSKQDSTKLDEGVWE